MASRVLYLRNMKRTKKLALNTETVRALDLEELRGVEGGAYANTQYRCAGGAQTVNAGTDGTSGELADYNQQINIIQR